MLKPNKFSMRNPRGVTVTCHHTMLLATRHKRTTPAGEGRYSIYLPRMDRRLSWPRWPDYAPGRESNQRPLDLRSDALPPVNSALIWPLKPSGNIDRLRQCTVVGISILRWPAHSCSKPRDRAYDRDVQCMSTSRLLLSPTAHDRRWRTTQ